jgi:hypothetical protein
MNKIENTQTCNIKEDGQRLIFRCYFFVDTPHSKPQCRQKKRYKKNKKGTKKGRNKTEKKACYFFVDPLPTSKKKTQISLK